MTGYTTSRYTPDPRRRAVWGHLCRYLARWIPADADVVELGAGYADFSNQVVARSRIAVDLDPDLPHRVEPGVRPIVADVTELSMLDTHSADVVFASNLLEHLDRPGVLRLLEGAARTLRPGGRLVLVQPNFRLRPREYFDDYTHVSVFTDRSLPDLLRSSGWSVEHVEARFLPLTLKSRLAFGHVLVPWYLRLPYRPLAGQMLVVASTSTSAPATDANDHERA